MPCHISNSRDPSESKPFHDKNSHSMEILLQAMLAILLLTIAGYAQTQLPAYTKGGAKLMMARTILVLVGIGFGLTSAAYADGRLPQLLVFLIGFGTVHVPAAVILFIKGRRGEGKS